MDLAWTVWTDTNEDQPVCLARVLILVHKYRVIVDYWKSKENQELCLELESVTEAINCYFLRTWRLKKLL